MQWALKCQVMKLLQNYKCHLHTALECSTVYPPAVVPLVVVQEIANLGAVPVVFLMPAVESGTILATIQNHML